MKRSWISIALLATLQPWIAGCSNPSEPSEESYSYLPPAPVELTIRYGHEATVPGTILRIAFGQVLGDSRCPVDVQCVWQGNAELEVGIRAGMGPTYPLRVNTHLDPRYADWYDVRVTLLELLPAPRSDVQLKPEDYTVRVKVETLGQMPPD